ncbi:MAG: nucleoside deaminase [Candidatus Omnitrophota bacterium]
MDEKFMLKAIEEARAGASGGHGGPFGAVIVKNGEIIASACNTVLRDNDPTQHAEIRAISLASKRLGNFDLTGCEAYSTTEPCPMCFAAIHWARISRLFYGTGIEDVKKLGFNELTIPVSQMKESGVSPVEVHGGFMREECEKLLRFWETLPNKRVY